ncbi:MAG: hypothetical protein ACKVE4_11045 [Dissulfuribacterales bacterium]
MEIIIRCEEIAQFLHNYYAVDEAAFYVAKLMNDHQSFIHGHLGCLIGFGTVDALMFINRLTMARIILRAAMIKKEDVNIMNKLTILIIMVISFGLIATQAMAGEDLAASDFFYGERIDNTEQVINVVDLHQKAEVITQSTELSASVFFYGESINNALVINNTAESQGRTGVAASLNDLLTPEVFYGYSDAVSVAAITRTSTVIVLSPPTRWISLS